MVKYLKEIFSHFQTFTVKSKCKTAYDYQIELEIRRIILSSEKYSDIFYFIYNKDYYIYCIADTNHTRLLSRYLLNT